VKRVLLIGGTSEIGLAIVRRLAAAEPVQTCLLGRDRERLEAALGELPAPAREGGSVVTVDARDTAAHDRAVAEAFSRHGGFDLVILAVGRLGAQAGLEADPQEAREVMETTFLGSASLLMAALRGQRAAGAGTTIVLSSVAGERVRASNAVYGAAKAGLDGLAQGLADELAGSGVRVLVVRPGFVHTKMTAGLKPAAFATTPEAVAEATVGALGGSAQTIWVPALLRYVFVILRHLPRAVFRRLPL
jgi:decaprenylphospho-beta-D-erythro-pentofuranosid-2-ulose 2-reductase